MSQWFALVVAVWSAFLTLLVAAPSSLDDVWHWLTGLPPAAEIPMWILMLPWALGLAAWESSWQEWLRLLAVVLLAVGWTVASRPRRER
jgi:ABC-type Fe3+-siderophore transport system permease subunit